MDKGKRKGEMNKQRRVDCGTCHAAYNVNEITFFVAAFRASLP